ncbi:MAG: ThiF family adenylyltransferase [Gemmatimonadaceae bacterium]
MTDALTPLIAGAADVREFLEHKAVRLEAPADIDVHQFHAAGFLLLANLCARLYPEIRIVAPERVSDEARRIALSINPACDVVLGTGNDTAAATLAWACPKPDARAIAIAPVGWEILVDLPDSEKVAPTNMLTALAAAAVGAGELFRVVFADFLSSGRSEASPGRFNVLTHAPVKPELPEMPSNIALGRVHLVGAGAVGQALVYALARVSASGTLVVVDPEQVTLSNLQRYVLTTDADVGKSKCQLVEQAFAKTKQIVPVSVEAPWSLDDFDLQEPEVICAAVDTERLRVELQGALPRRIYNAWTQPADLGWSRHERFGIDPCLACLYWPTTKRSSLHENVARAIRQDALRVLGYLINSVPVDQPLRAEQIPRVSDLPVPPEASIWTERPLLDDIGAEFELDQAQVAVWQGKLLGDLYRDGICGGALVHSRQVEIPVEMAVPLAHQSIFAGIMLAVQLLAASSPDLRGHRGEAIEYRLDLLAGLPQIAARPRARTPGCICDDEDYVLRYREKWKDGAS